MRHESLWPSISFRPELRGRHQNNFGINAQFLGFHFCILNDSHLFYCAVERIKCAIININAACRPATTLSCSSNFHFPIPLGLKTLCAYSILYTHTMPYSCPRTPDFRSVGERWTFGRWLASLTSSVKQSNANSCHFLQVRHRRKAEKSGAGSVQENYAHKRSWVLLGAERLLSSLFFYVHSSSVCFPGSLSLFVAPPLIMLWKNSSCSSRKNEWEKYCNCKSGKKYNENVAL